MKTITKALTGTIAAGAMAITSASPAFAEHRDGRRGDGISAGDVIAGALIIGGIAAVASAASNNDRDYRGYPGDYGYDRAGYRDGYRGDYGRGYYRDNPRQAVEQCVYAAERYASGRGMRADVTDIRQVKDTRYGFEVKGRIAVQGQGRGWNRGYYNGDSRYGQGWGGDYRGWNSSMRGYDRGSFKCKFEQGRVVDVDIDGIRGF